MLGFPHLNEFLLQLESHQLKQHIISILLKQYQYNHLQLHVVLLCVYDMHKTCTNFHKKVSEYIN